MIPLGAGHFCSKHTHQLHLGRGWVNGGGGVAYLGMTHSWGVTGKNNTLLARTISMNINSQKCTWKGSILYLLCSTYKHGSDAEGSALRNTLYSVLCH